MPRPSYGYDYFIINERTGGSSHSAGNGHEVRIAWIHCSMWIDVWGRRNVWMQPWFLLVRNLITKKAFRNGAYRSVCACVCIKSISCSYEPPPIRSYWSPTSVVRNYFDFFTIKPTRCTDSTNLFWHETLHVSDSSYVHHQGFIHSTLSNGICHTCL
jgi:hypothetical protein